MSAYGYQAHRWAHQCVHCNHVRGSRIAYYHCPNCNERVQYDALDQPVYTCRTIDVTRIVLLAENISRAAHMEWARRLGRMEACP